MKQIIYFFAFITISFGASCRTLKIYNNQTTTAYVNVKNQTAPVWTIVPPTSRFDGTLPAPPAHVTNLLIRPQEGLRYEIPGDEPISISIMPKEPFETKAEKKER